ncbi:long-chain-fatty acid--ACP ligase MbtM [Gordonia sp. HY442]|uniref:long-chain-fatty acid--ACP ligase MbtM n=1 Tax=Gordonia zhenghanii TaxID=2911516 RepID=UPI001F17DACE|nr:long-chain-fatty acid--ACP ligase MbtM [Gordonia zhenghanii]MCF8602666.1 long-chain-fatty acid--ACP ligase MbtM [Gordonia zhenghanii]
MTQPTVLDVTEAPSVFTEPFSRAMLTSEESLAVLNSETGEWDSRPWPQVHERAVEVAATLVVQRRDDAPHVGLIGDPTVDLIAGIQGAWLAGVAVSILPGPIRGADEKRWAEGTLERFARIGVGTVLGDGSQLDLLAEADLGDRVGGGLRLVAAREFGVGADVANFVPVDAGPDAPAVLQGTAGSTGEPKTAVLPGAAVHTNTRELVVRLGMHHSRDVGFSWLPLYHDMGLTFLLATMGSGMESYIVPNSAFAAAPFKWLEWLTETKATVTAAPNFAYDILGRYGRLLKSADLSGVRVAISGGEPIDPDAFDKFLAETARFGFDPAAAAPAYGMAESTCAVTMPSTGEGAAYDEVTVTVPGEHSEPMRRRYAILGKPLDGMEIRIVEPIVDVPLIDDRDVGRVEIRGTSMMAGYLGHEPIADGDWFDTGDLGYLVDGRLVICGRVKEIVIVAGRNLFPVEVERAAASVDGVKRGGVVAMARGEGARGEGAARPGLVVVAEHRSDDAAITRSAVVSAVASECGIVPAEVILVEPGTVPRTTSGKLRRLETKQLVESGALS